MNRIEWRAGGPSYPLDSDSYRVRREVYLGRVVYLGVLQVSLTGAVPVGPIRDSVELAREDCERHAGES